MCAVVPGDQDVGLQSHGSQRVHAAISGGKDMGVPVCQDQRVVAVCAQEAGASNTGKNTLVFEDFPGRRTACWGDFCVP